MQTPFEDEQEPELTEAEKAAEDEFYYSLNRRSAEKQDNPFSGWAALVFFGVLFLVPLFSIALAFVGNASAVFAIILLVILIAVVPVALIPLALFGGLTLSSIVASLRDLFKPRK